MTMQPNGVYSWPPQFSRRMADCVHAEVRQSVANTRLQRNSKNVALLHKQDLEIGAMLGKGAFSEVHEVRCRQDPSRRVYALKHLKFKLMTQPENFRLAAAELAMEAHMLASFDHPNIMKIRGWAANGVASYAQGTHDAFFLLLDKLDETLDARIELWRGKQEALNAISHPGFVHDLMRRFSTSDLQAQQLAMQQHMEEENALLLERLRVCTEIASGLAYLHSKGVIFRDLKPNNIGFLNGHVQLFDFGLSRELPKANLTEPFAMSGKVGTLRYMAVEVAMHQPYNVSADVYSWAMVAYEAITGIKPFASWTREMHSNLVCARGVRPECDMLPPAIRSLLEAGWAQSPHARPNTLDVVQHMIKLEEEQIMICAPCVPQPVVELPNNFNTKIRKAPGRAVSETFTASTMSLSTDSARY